MRIEVTGPIPATPPEKLIVIANHQCFLDAFLVGTNLPFELHWIVHTQIAAQWHFKQFLKLVPHIVVDTTNPLAMKSIVQLIDAGKPVCIFPEGRLTNTGSLMKVYDGLAFLQSKTGATVVPAIIDGAAHSKVSKMKPPFPIKRRPPVRVTFFEPMTPPVPVGRTGRERRRDASNNMRRAMEDMWFRAQPVKTLFETFLDTIDTYGKNAPSVEDIQFQPKSYGDMLKGSLALGRLVSRLSVEKETVGVLMPNVAPALMLLYGMFAMRRVPAMINYTSGVDGMQNACFVANIKTIITSRAFLEKAKLTEKVAQLKNVRVVCLEDLRPQFGFTDKLWLILYALRWPRSVMIPAKPEDAAVVLFTSGSEGKPKGVVLSHKSILANINQIRSVIEFSNRDKFLVALPMFHSFGLTAGALLSTLNGVPLFLYPSPLHYRMVPEMSYDRDCTVLFGTSTFLGNYARMAHDYDFYSLRYVISGAERLTDAVRETYHRKFGLRIMEGYGATEFSPVVSVNTPYFYRPGTVGKMLPGVECKLEPVEGIEQGSRLHIKGPNQMLGYLLNDKPGELRQPESTMGEGWYDTGDIVTMEDGYVQIVARAKRFAKIAGEMVSLEVVEQIAATTSPKKAHAATSIPSDRRGETIILFTEDPELRREHLQAAARESGKAEVVIPRSVVYRDKLPRLGNGKVDYVTLKELANQK